MTPAPHAPDPRMPRRTRWLAAFVLVAATAVGSLSLADSIDPRRANTVVVGRPGGPAAGARLDPHARGISATPLPANPTLKWRREEPGGLDHGPAVADDGTIFLALTNPELVAIDKDGQKRLWRRRLGLTPPVRPPVLTTDGAVAVVSSDGILWMVRRDGTIRSRTPLKTGTRRGTVPPLAMDDGSVIVAGESALVHVGADGRVRRRTATGVGALEGSLLRYDGGVLAIARSGDVIHWRAPRKARKKGSFGGTAVGGAVRLDARTLAAVVDGKRVVTLNLDTGARRTLLSDPMSGTSFEGPPALDARGELHVTTVAGELFSVDRRGTLLRQDAVENAMLLFRSDAGALAGIFRRLNMRPSPPLISDASGRVLFVRASGRIGVMEPQGAPRGVVGRFCSRPIAMRPAGRGKIVVACRGGSVGLFDG